MSSQKLKETILEYNYHSQIFGGEKLEELARKKIAGSSPSFS